MVLSLQDMILLSLISKNGQTLSYPLDNSDTWLSQLTKESSHMKMQGRDTSEERLLDSSIDLLVYINLT